MRPRCLCGQVALGAGFLQATRSASRKWKEEEGASRREAAAKSRVLRSGGATQCLLACCARCWPWPTRFSHRVPCGLSSRAAGQLGVGLRQPSAPQVPSAPPPRRPAWPAEATALPRTHRRVSRPVRAPTPGSASEESHAEAARAEGPLGAQAQQPEPPQAAREVHRRPLGQRGGGGRQARGGRPTSRGRRAGAFTAPILSLIWLAVSCWPSPFWGPPLTRGGKDCPHRSWHWPPPDKVRTTVRR